MKKRILVVTWMVIGVSCILTHAQDMNRVPDINQGVDAVDASVHADIEDIEKQRPQPSQSPVKLPSTYSRWAFNSSGQIPTAQYWRAHTIITTSTAAAGDGESPSALSRLSFQAIAQPAASAEWPFHATDTTIVPKIDVNSGKFGRQPSPFHSLDFGRAEDGSTGPQPFKTKVPLLSPQPQADGYSTPFREKQFGLASDSSARPSVFPKKSFSSQRDRATASQSKIHAKKSLDSKHTGTIAGFSSGREKPGRSRLSTNAD